MKLPSNSPDIKRAIGLAIGAALAERRKEKGMTQGELAAAVGIGDEAISRIERGMAIPAYMRFHDFAAVLECDVASLALPGTEHAFDEASLLAAELAGLPEQARKRLVQSLVDGARFERASMAKSG